MSNPAAPVLINILTQLQAMINTIATGDPMLVGARIEPAVQIFLGQVTLQIPGLAGAGLTTLQTDINTKIDGIITQLKAQA